MNIGKTLFAQLMDFLPWTTFPRIVDRYGGDRYVEVADLRRTIPRDGLCATDLPREPARHRGLSVGAGRPSSTTWACGRRSSARRWPMPTRRATGASTPNLPSA